MLKQTTNTKEMNDRFLVIHPLDDVPETKLDASGLGPMRMTRSVRYSLFALRAYLILMVLLLLYHAFTLAARTV